MIKSNLGMGYCTTFAGALALIAAPAHAEINVIDAQAQNQPTVVEITPGKTTAVNFQNQETISYVGFAE